MAEQHPLPVSKVSQWRPLRGRQALPLLVWPLLVWLLLLGHMGPLGLVQVALLQEPPPPAHHTQVGTAKGFVMALYMYLLHMDYSCPG